ncbi:hypothetical protein ACJX0J_037416, partial [Zea mays]
MRRSRRNESICLLTCWIRRSYGSFFGHWLLLLGYNLQMGRQTYRSSHFLLDLCRIVPSQGRGVAGRKKDERGGAEKEYKSRSL